MTRQRMMNILGAMTAQEKELFALMDCLPREDSELEENILLMRILQTREYDCVGEWLELLKKMWTRNPNLTLQDFALATRIDDLEVEE